MDAACLPRGPVRIPEVDEKARPCRGHEKRNGAAREAIEIPMLAIAPDLVNMDVAIECPKNLWPETPPFDTIPGSGVYPIPTLEHNPDGHAGTDPRKATAEISNQLFDTLARNLIPPQFKRVWRKATPSD